jgi:hypothetical protein
MRAYVRWRHGLGSAQHDNGCETRRTRGRTALHPNPCPDFARDTLSMPPAGPYRRQHPTELFYTDEAIQAIFRGFVTALVTRRNSLTGVPYAHEPAILAWELANEPRCEGRDPSELHVGGGGEGGPDGRAGRGLRSRSVPDS